MKTSNSPSPGFAGQAIDGLTCFTVELTVARSPLSDNMGCLILESDPTPDYYAKGNFPPNENRVSDRHLLLPVKKSINCFQDVIYRKASLLAEKHGSNLSIYPGQMMFQNEERQCIRLNLNLTSQLPDLIKEFTDLGINFYPDKKVKEYSSLITYKKYTSFLNIEEGVYKDENNPNRYFFEISNPVEFEQFKNGIERIKNNCDYHLFDAFLVFLFYKDKVRDFIGLYSEHCDMNRFSELRQQIKKIFEEE